MEIVINSLPLPVKKDVSPEDSSASRVNSDSNSSFKQYISQISTTKGDAKVISKKPDNKEDFLTEEQDNSVPPSLLWQLLWQITLQNENAEAIKEINGSDDWQTLIKSQGGLDSSKIELSKTNPLSQETLDMLLRQIKELGLTESANTVLTNIATEDVTNLVDMQLLETYESSENESFLIKDETGHLEVRHLNLATNNKDKLVEELTLEKNCYL